MPQPRKGPVTGPARYIQHPDQFGNVDPGIFPPVAADEEDLRRAAQVQHDFVRLVKVQIPRLDLDEATVARQVGISTEHFQRILRGASTLRFPVMLRIARAVAIEITVGFKATE